jgi:hypothetical protein
VSLADLAAVLAELAPCRPHAIVGVLGDGSTGVLRLQFTEPATDAEVAHVVDVLTDYVPLPMYIETMWTPRTTRVA